MRFHCPPVPRPKVRFIISLLQQERMHTRGTLGHLSPHLLGCHFSPLTEPTLIPSAVPDLPLLCYFTSTPCSQTWPRGPQHPLSTGLAVLVVFWIWAEFWATFPSQHPARGR